MTDSARARVSLALSRGVRGVPPLMVVARRGDVIESRHEVHLEAVHEGRTVVSVGETGAAWPIRSCAKPFQALLLAEAFPDLTREALAIACASHTGTSDQMAAVAALLDAAPAASAPLSESMYIPLAHECSGNHAGLLAVSLAAGWSPTRYWRSSHPAQVASRSAIAGAADLDGNALPVGIDGCGIPTWALTLEALARAFGRLERMPGGHAVATAMMARPDLVGGSDQLDTRVMAANPGWLAKRGAQGIFCLVTSEGVAIAAKCVDGASSALEPALAWLLGALGIPSSLRPRIPISDAHGVPAGRLTVELDHGGVPEASRGDRD